MLKLIWRNTLRHPLRAGLTVAGMALAVLAFCVLRTMVAAWYSSVDASSPIRLITRHAVALTSTLPLSHLARIQSLPGITGVSYSHWFGGIYLDEKHFFPQFATSMARTLELMKEFIIPPDQKAAVLADRRACLAGRKLVARNGWRLGDSIILKGTIFPGELRLVLRGIYRGRYAHADETHLLFHWDYLNECLKKTCPERADQVGWFFVEVPRPDLTGPVSAQIDALFKNSLAETLTETEAAYQMNFVAMTKDILLAIQAVSWMVIEVILTVLANTMAMSARERLGECAVLKTMGFQARHLAGLILGESLLLAAMGGALGVSLAFPVVRSFPASLEQYFGVLPLTRETVVLGLAVSLAVGVVAAVLPAWRAARVSIDVALRRVG